MSYPVCTRCGEEEMLCIVRRECVDRAWLEVNGEIAFRRYDENDYDILEMRCRECNEVLRDEQGNPIISARALLDFYRRNEAEFTKLAAAKGVEEPDTKEKTMDMKGVEKSTFASPKDKEESHHVAKLVRAKERQCYLNAFHVVQEVDAYGDADYIEGFVVDERGLFLEHGWVERQGIVVDPTLPDHDCRYVAGLRFHGQSGLAQAMIIPKPEHTKDDLPFFYRFGWGGSDHPDFAKARADAEAIALGKSPHGLVY